MPERCPRCRTKLHNPRALVCPACHYSLRLPIVGLAGAVLIVGGLAALFYALFSEEMFMELVTGGFGAIVVGMAALAVAGLLIGRARRT